MRKMPKRCVLWGMPWRMNTAYPIMDELIPQLPLSREQRPGWDKACLERLGCRDVLVRAALPPDIMNDYYRIRYTHIPMFLVRGIKQ